MSKILLCLTMVVFSCNGLTSAEETKVTKEDTAEPLSLLEQWAKFSDQPGSAKPEAKSELEDTVCGSVPAEGNFSPNKYIARLNGAQMIHDYPTKCKEHYMNMMVDIICSFIEDLNAQKLVDIEIMMQEILALRTEKNKEGIDKVLEKIKNLKEQ